MSYGTVIDLLYLFGAALVATGVSIVWSYPFGMIAMGVLLIVMALLGARSFEEEDAAEDE